MAEPVALRRGVGHAGGEEVFADVGIAIPVAGGGHVEVVAEGAFALDPDGFTGHEKPALKGLDSGRAGQH
jgi:hypothetical protein